MNSGIIVLLVMAAFIIGAALAWFFSESEKLRPENPKYNQQPPQKILLRFQKYN